MDAEQVINQITEQIDLLNQQPLDDFSGDTLTRIAVRLASYKAGLGRHSTIAKKATWIAEKNYSEARASGYKKLRDEGKGTTDADSMKNLEATEQYSLLIEAKELEDKITTLSYNVHDLIDAIKSRTINLQMEMRESNG